jgi:hypothetical protein
VRHDYDLFMHRPIHRLPICRGRLTALAALIAFVVANVGCPLTTGSVAGGSCCKVSGLATCCCGDKPGAKNCGCNHALVTQPATAKIPASCCQKRLVADEKAPVVVNCACGDSSSPAFLVLTQPRLAIVAVTVTELTMTGILAPVHLVAVPDATSAPETPPPRSSVA